MDFLKQNLFYIVCGLVAVAGIALIVTGVQAMPKVHEELTRVENLHRSLTGLQSQPANLARIDKAKEQIRTITEDWERVRERAQQLYDYELLVPDVLPYGDALSRTGFRNEYWSVMDRLMERLNYGNTATSADVAFWRGRIEEEEADRREFGLNHPSAPLLYTGPPRTPAGIVTKAGAQMDPRVRAELAAAQRIFMYATHWTDEKAGEIPATLDFWTPLRDRGAVEAPDEWDVWHAQYNYWIHKDVIDAVTGVNNEAARRLRDAGEHPWVGNMPVKELISVRVSATFVPRDGEYISPSQPGGVEAVLPPVSPENAFTHNGSNELFEVIQFTVKAVMDQRDIPLVIDRLSENSMHTLLRVSYKAVPPNRNMIGKIYGSEPAVNVVMDFETMLLGEVFRRLMPASVRDSYGVRCRPLDECVESPVEG